ncbi:MAG: hypothetical protein ABJ340_13625, partial [Paraglaciecola sp.]
MNIIPSKQMMQAVKFVVGLFPSKFRKNMRSRLWLFNLYSKSLQKSGLFYGFPSPQKLQKLYVKTIKKQNADIANKLKHYSVQRRVNGLVMLTGKSKFDKNSIEALLDNPSICKVFVSGQTKTVDLMLDELNLTSDKPVYDLRQIEKEELSVPLFIIAGGDFIHSQALALMHTYLTNPDESKVLYCDVDHFDKSQVRYRAELYPDWNPDLQLATGYVNTGVMLCGAEIIEHFCQFADQTISSSVMAIWLVDIYLKNNSVPIVHIPFSLVHKSLKNPVNWESELLSLDYPKFISNNRKNSEVAQVKWDTSTTPMVSLVIPTKNAKELV